MYQTFVYRILFKAEEWEIVSQILLRRVVESDRMRLLLFHSTVNIGAFQLEQSSQVTMHQACLILCLLALPHDQHVQVHKGTLTVPDLRKISPAKTTSEVKIPLHSITLID